MKKNMKTRTFVCVLCCLLLQACGNQRGNAQEETQVLIETSKGDIRIRLFNDTPLHRDNFIRLVKSGAYDNIVFHRIVRNFMIQTGDPALKPAGTTAAIDTSSYNYTVPAEIRCPQHFHKKGALGAAREPDYKNPEKASSGTQFYIVTGRTYKASELMELYSAIYQSKIDTLYEQKARARMDELIALRRSGEKKRLDALQDSLLQAAEEEIAANPPLEFGKAQKEAYVTVGGAPHLDGEYTVFGEVVEGLNVVEAIGKTRTQGERPLQEVVVKKVTVIE